MKFILILLFFVNSIFSEEGDGIFFWKLKNSNLSLKGNWFLYHKKIVSKEEVLKFLANHPTLFKDETRTKEDFEFLRKELGTSISANVPSEWPDLNSKQDSNFTNEDYGTFIAILEHEYKERDVYIKSLEQGTAFLFYTVSLPLQEKEDKDFIFRNGTVGETRDKSIPQILPVLEKINFKTNSELLVMQVSNFHHRQGGFWSVVELDSTKRIIALKDYERALALVTLGVILIMALYHFVLFLERREDFASLIFGIFCFTICFRALATSRILHDIFSEASVEQFEILYKIEYLSVYIGVPMFTLFITHVFSIKFNMPFSKWLNIANSTLAVPFVFSVVFFETRVFSYYIKYFYIIMYVVAILILFNMVVAVKRKLTGSIQSLLGTIALVLIFVQDQLYSVNIISTGYYIQYGFMVFIFTQSLILSSRFSLAFRESEQLSTSMARFVPTQFINFLNKKSLIDVKHGDAVSKVMTVLFMDIRNFTSISEKMTPEENFKFLNQIFKIMVVPITENGGFVDKFIGDSIMALFPISADSAIEASRLMIVNLDSYNNERKKQGLDEIQIGIGINTGKLILGTVGTSERINTTVIGDTVNLASRMESLTKEYSEKIIFTEFTKNNILNLSKFTWKNLGQVKVKGKEKPTEVFALEI
ncbi:MAG: adenylate/guanylate cyclase domain-containing protein [Leptospiraceae bacterium]|nr:adenylate/guanylate cyclase domain-containing protein [Leptospiraceae bacterium]